jgi:hypothetical protein
VDKLVYGQRHSEPETSMRTSLVVVPEVEAEHGLEMTTGRHDEMI